MANIRHLLSIKKTEPNKVYEALTTAAGIRSWWTDNADLDEIVGEGIFRFHYGNIVETRVNIVKLQEPVVVSWEVSTSFRPEQNGTFITFELRPEDNGTVLVFSHTGFAEEDQTYALMNTGWAYYLVSLQQYLETGKGAPSPFVDFGIMMRARNQDEIKFSNVN